VADDTRRVFIFEAQHNDWNTLGGGVSVQNCSLWRDITSEPRSPAGAADTADATPSLASFRTGLFDTQPACSTRFLAKWCCSAPVTPRVLRIVGEIEFAEVAVKMLGSGLLWQHAKFVSVRNPIGVADHPPGMCRRGRFETDGPMTFMCSQLIPPG
jgi:hypothetical protein